MCEITGDVLFACAATLPSDLFIAGSESGTIYFLDVDEHDEDAAIVFSFQAHSSTIRAVRAVRTGTKPHATYRVISTDVENSVRVHNVDPFVAKTATMETDFDMPVATTQVSEYVSSRPSARSFVRSLISVPRSRRWGKQRPFFFLSSVCL